VTDSISIRYENTEHDVVAFNRHWHDRSPGMRRAKRLATWTLPLLVVAGTAVADVLRGSVRWTPWGVVFGVFYVPFYLHSYRRNVRQATRSYLADGRNESVLCEHELEITPEGLVERTPVSEGRTAWSGIERVDVTPDRTYVFVQTAAAHIIPRERVTQGDYESFVAAVQEAVQAAR
jgi:hypothetical protein